MNKITLKAHKTQIHYCVPLSDEQWKSLNRINRRGDDRYAEVVKKLKKSGVDERSIEYNGHFGRNIFFALEDEKHLPRTLRKIERIVSK